jgi:hypothetical protein
VRSIGGMRSGSRWWRALLLATSAEVTELGVARSHAVQSPRGQRGVEVVEEPVVSECVDRGRVAGQGLDGLQVEVDARPAELPASIEPCDVTAEVANQRLANGTALVDPFLQCPVRSCAYGSAIPIRTSLTALPGDGRDPW